MRFGRFAIVILGLLISFNGVNELRAQSRPAADEGGPAVAFAPVRDWWYRGRPLPNAGSEAAVRMARAYAEHPEDPDVMQWTAVAETYGLFKTNTTPKDLTIAAAEKGQPAAMARYAQGLLEGDNIPRDPDRALQLLDAALARNEPSAALEYGRAYLQGSGGLVVNLDKAEEYLRRAVDMGHVRAHHLLAMLYHKRGDNGRILAELRAGAEGGDEAAMYSLAEAYQKGYFATKRDPSQALEWFRKAAERGSASGQREIVKAILTGYGGVAQDERNLATARMLLGKAVASKDIEATRLLARSHLTGELGVEFAPDRAVELLQQAVDLKDPAAQFDLGVLYVEGLLVPRDLDKARGLIRRASEAGFAPATAYLRRFDVTPDNAPNADPSPHR